MEKSGKAKQVFKKVLGDSTNFWCQEILGYYEYKGWNFELCKNCDAFRNPYAVTVISPRNKHMTVLGSVFKTKEEAFDYMKNIEEKEKGENKNGKD